MTAEGQQKRLILWAITMSLAGIVTLYVLFLLRQVLLLLYVSTLLAIGFSPAVRWIERQRLGIGARQFPRWAAILLLYVGFIGLVTIVLSIVVPPLVSQLTELWQKPNAGGAVLAARHYQPIDRAAGHGPDHTPVAQRRTDGQPSPHIPNAGCPIPTTR